MKTLDEAIGKVEVLDIQDAIDHWKASGLDLSPLLHLPDIDPNAPRRCTKEQDHGLAKALDQKLIELSQPALNGVEGVRIDLPVRNVNRTVGTMLGSKITEKFGGVGLPDDTISITLRGSAGQSLGAFIPKGLTIKLFGDSNDYVGKGLSGGRIIVRPNEMSNFIAEENIIAGNVIAYGATSGEIFIRGVVGERFCVRNSGATAVVEGVGDHACEYMTGGTVVILGKTGRNVAAGMSGGRLFVLDLDPNKVNTELVDLIPVPVDQIEKLRNLVKLHADETDSKSAANLLADFDVSRFTMVMPRDYARVLSAISRAEAEGKPVDIAVMEVAHG